MRVVQGSREPLRRTRAAGSRPCSLGDLDELRDMKDPGYFRRSAERTRQPSGVMLQAGIRETLLKLARDYDELAGDLESGTAAIRHPELLPSRSIYLGDSRVFGSRC